MADFIIARAAHILAVLMWIGGVGFVTLRWSRKFGQGAKLIPT